MGKVKLKYDDDTKNALFYDVATSETVLVAAPVHFKDDFLGKEFLKTEGGSTGQWATVEANLNTAIAVAANVANGALDMIVDSDNNAEDAVAYWGDQKGINVKADAMVEFRLTMQTMTTGPVVVFGMAGDHDLTKDNITEHAWFRLEGDSALLVESDDTTNNNDDVDASTTLVAGTYAIFQIDFTDISDVKFRVNGTRVAAGTTFDMSNLTDDEAIMQPYISIDKGADTTVATVRLDKVEVWSQR